MDHTTARKLAQQWCDAWNSRDLEKILEHYADDIVLTSPYALKRLGEESKGQVVGKEMLRKYFAIGLESIPDLHFELVDVLLGVNEVAVLYKRESGATVVDLMSYDENNKAKT